MKTVCAANTPNCSVCTAFPIFCFAFKVRYCLLYVWEKKKNKKQTNKKLKLKEQLISYVKDTLVEHLFDTLHLGESVLEPCFLS